MDKYPNQGWNDMKDSRGKSVVNFPESPGEFYFGIFVIYES